MTASLKIKIKVGESIFETAKEELLGQDKDSYFHAHLSNRWSVGNDDGNNDGGTSSVLVPVLTIPERSGRLFRYVLYYLEFGDIPRETLTGESLLDQKTLAELKVDADFFMLPGLVKSCTTTTSEEEAVSEYYESLHKSTTFREKAEQRVVAKLDALAGTMDDEEEILKMYLEVVDGDWYCPPTIESSETVTKTYESDGKTVVEEYLVFTLYYGIPCDDESPFHDWFHARYDCNEEDYCHSGGTSSYCTTVTKKVSEKLM